MADDDDPGFAPAKINLTLHVTGRRADGYHLLDSLVAFADVGDRISAEAGDGLSLAVDGPMAGDLPAGADNLVLGAARLIGGERPPGARLRLTKRLPVASGIGGGSADAAAALRVLARLWNLPLPGPAAAAGLGADVPVCLASRPGRMRGIGELVAPVPPLPPAWLVLANPRRAVPTPAIFRTLDARDNPAMPDPLPDLSGFDALAGFLARCRNDLESPARALEPAIGDVLAALRGTVGCAIARMSGSGATCFGLYAGSRPARAAAAAIRAGHPGWWVVAAPLRPDPPAPQAMRSTT